MHIHFLSVKVGLHKVIMVLVINTSFFYFFRQLLYFFIIPLYCFILSVTVASNF